MTHNESSDRPSAVRGEPDPPEQQLPDQGLSRSGEAQAPAAQTHEAQTHEAQTKEAQTHKFVVRLPMPLRHRIAQAAKYYRRSMNSEIVARLEQSLQGIPSQAVTEQLAPQMHDVMQNVFATDLNEQEEALLRAFRRLPVEKQRSLLELLS